MEKKEIKGFISGTHNLIQDEIIPDDAASDSLGWITRDGRIELMRGRQTLGGDGAAGKVYMLHVGYQADGTAVNFRKVGTTIQALVGSTWTNCITGLTEEAEYTASNYQSLAGAFTYFFGVDGIYKVSTASPTDFAAMYVEGTNFKGFGFIDKGRTLLWGREEDPTGFYGSWIDAQDSGVYTTVAAEAQADVSSGTLVFKAAEDRRTCFAVELTVTTSGQVFTDDFNGVLTGDFTTDDTGAGTADYQWEDSNAEGVTDFTKSATRIAGEGFVIRQDAGGDRIRTVIPFDGSYFSLKANSCYKFTLDAADVAPVNEIFRTDIGVSSLRSAVGTGIGIVFMNTANESKPRLNVIERNPLGDNFTNRDLFPHFKFEKYTFDDVALDSWDRYIVVGCRDESDINNRTLMCNVKDNSVDITPYGIRAFSKDAGVLYGGDSVSTAVFELFLGFDDDGFAITNFWESKNEEFGDNGLKRVKRLRFKGMISPDQEVTICMQLDDGGDQLVGTIRGDGSYVNSGQTAALGSYMVGTQEVGGAGSVEVSDYYLEIKVRVTKFQKRKLRIVANSVGYFDIESIEDFDIWRYQDKIPSKYRQKQNVSLDSTSNNNDNPEY
jgi:hypothetical protein